jgi:hypothetical protein
LILLNLILLGRLSDQLDYLRVTVAFGVSVPIAAAGGPAAPTETTSAIGLLLVPVAELVPLCG